MGKIIERVRERQRRESERRNNPWIGQWGTPTDVATNRIYYITKTEPIKAPRPWWRFW